MLLANRDPVQEQLLLRQRLETIGMMSTGIAHDVNNLLGVIVASIDYVDALPELRRPNDPDVSSCLSDIHKAAKRATELSRRLLSYTRRNEEGVVDVSLLCLEVIRLLERTFSRSFELKSSIAPGLLVEGRSGELHQVLMNLCLNAREAVEGAGRITLVAEVAREMHREMARLPKEVPFIAVSVADTGLGMGERTQDEIFEPFFTTKSGTCGTGLGLTMVRRIVADHSGKVHLETAIGEGSTFFIFLPRNEGELPSGRVRVTTADGLLPVILRDGQQEGTVLLADDELLVRRSIGRLLEQAGYKVIYSDDGAEALAAYEAGRESIDLSIIDVDMPQLGGAALVARLRALDRNAQVICISGNFDPETQRELDRLGVIALVEKPCGAEDLIDFVKLVLA